MSLTLPPPAPLKKDRRVRDIPFPPTIQRDLQKVEEHLQSLSRLENHPQASTLLKHVLQNGGKRIRPALALMSGAFYNCDLDRMVTLASAVELLHTATLLHDDTVDNSDLRRGRPTVNSLWGGGRAVLLGDYLFSKSAHMVASLGNSRLIGLFADTLMTISMAELDQTLNGFQLKKSRDGYFRWISGKTASIFAMATESGGILSAASEEDIAALRTYGLHLGLAFQIVDDILDFTGEEKEMGKPVGSDLMQGALTLPVILLLESEPANDLVRTIYERRESLPSVRMVLDRIVNSPILQECYKIANEQCSIARAALRDLPQKPVRQALDEIAEFVVERKR
ncbi:MAG: hypothetical protein HW414_511 [Dehalococcoidia bacterium]|nr:hypothetical protein [Dehalococcoidia bacterium]